MPPEAVFRTYDIADLLRPARDYPLPPEDGAQQPGGKSLFPRTPQPVDADREVSTEAFQKLITELVSPESWKSGGGTGRSPSRRRAMPSWSPRRRPIKTRSPRC